MATALEGDPLAAHSLSPRALKDLLAAERSGEPFLALRDGDRGARAVPARARRTGAHDRPPQGDGPGDAYNAATAAPPEETEAAGESPRTVELTPTQRRVLVALCRPYRDGASFATPASNQQIAAELFLSVDAVKMHLRTLFGRFELADLPQNLKRARLAECVLQFGLISPRELD